MTKLYNEGRKDLKPDVVAYTGVMQALVKRRDPEGTNIHAVRKATEILEYIERLYESTGDIRIRPDRSMYNVAYRAWERCPGPESRSKRQIIKQKMHNASSYRNPLRKPLRRKVRKSRTF